MRSLLGEATARRARTRSRGLFASCSRSRRRSSSCSTTCSGARSRSSISSSRRGCSPPARRSCCCAWLGRSCSSDALHGRCRSGWSRSQPAEAEALIGQFAARGSTRPHRREVGREPALHHRDAGAGEATGAELEVPPTPRALLTARLDQLDRRSAQCSSGERSRARSSTAAQCRRSPPTRRRCSQPRSARPGRADPPRPAPVPRRGRLPLPPSAHPRRRLRRPAEGVRADLHRRLADWLEERTRLVEQDELAGYHLEQAARYQAELGGPHPALTLRAEIESWLPGGGRSTGTTPAPQSGCTTGRSSSRGRSGRTFTPRLDLARPSRKIRGEPPGSARRGRPGRGGRRRDGRGRSGGRWRVHFAASRAGRTADELESCPADPVLGWRRSTTMRGSRRSGTPSVSGWRTGVATPTNGRRHPSRPIVTSGSPVEPAWLRTEISGSPGIDGSRPAERRWRASTAILADARYALAAPHPRRPLAMLERGAEPRQAAGRRKRAPRGARPPVGASGCIPRSPSSPAIMRDASRRLGCSATGSRRRSSRVPRLLHSRLGRVHSA